MIRPVVIKAVENVFVDVPAPVSPSARRSRARALNRTNFLLQSRFGGREATFLEASPEMTRLRFNGVAGFVGLGDLQCWVRPKVMTLASWEERFARLAALGLRHRPRAIVLLPGAISAPLLSTAFVDLIAFRFASEVQRAAEEHPLLLFRRERRGVPALRGRLLIERQVTAGPHRAHAFWCDYSLLASDNPLVRLLHWAFEFFLRSVRLAGTARVLRSVRALLPNAPPRVEPYALVRGLPPAAVKYREAIEIAREIARHGRPRSPRQHEQLPDPRQAASVVARMEDLFEGAVVGLLERAAARLTMVHRQQQTLSFANRTLAEGVGVGKPRRCTKPDDVLMTAETIRIVADAKYKGRITEPVGEGSTRSRLPPEDFYQVFSAAVSAGVRTGVLIQPRIEDLPDWVGSFEVWQVDPGQVLSAPVLLEVIRIDLRVLSDSAGVQALTRQLESGVRRLLTLGAEANQAGSWTTRGMTQADWKV